MILEMLIKSAKISKISEPSEQPPPHMSEQDGVSARLARLVANPVRSRAEFFWNSDVTLTRPTKRKDIRWRDITKCYLASVFV